MATDVWHPAPAPRPTASLTQALIARSAPFSAASVAARAAFAAGARRISVRAGETAFRSGEPAHTFVFVARGIVKLVRSRCGRSAIADIFGPGEAVGAPFALRDVAYPVDAVAVTPVAELVEIPRLEVLEAARREPPFALALAEACAVGAGRMYDAHAIMAAGGTEARLAALLGDLAERFGDVDEDGLLRVPLALSRGELAACICTTTETVIRLMSRWAREGLVDTEAGGFVIRDVERLRALAEPLYLRTPKHRDELHDARSRAVS